MLLFCVFNMYFTALYDKCNTTGWMKDYWMDERHQLTYRKCVSHAVEMVDGCSKENGVLCTAA